MLFKLLIFWNSDNKVKWYVLFALIIYKEPENINLNNS